MAPNTPSSPKLVFSTAIQPATIAMIIRAKLAINGAVIRPAP